MHQVNQLPREAHLTDPLNELPEPVPNYGCDICKVLGQQREAARNSGNPSAVSDCNVEIRQHPHGERR